MKLRYKILNSILGLIVAGVAVLAVVISYTEDCDPAPAYAGAGDSVKVIRYRCYGSPDVLEYADVEKPVPADDELLVRVRAAGVNPYDSHFMTGSPYFMRLLSGIGAPDETRLGVDFAGEVEAVGANVTEFAPGDRVYGGATGAFGEYLTVGQDRAVAKIPDNVTFEDAAGMPIAAITAIQALRDKAGVESGDKVLINGASGGVGTYAVQIAKHYGANVTGVCSTRNVELVMSLGADQVVDYKQASYIDGGVTYDVIIDNVGNHTLSDNGSVLADDGRLVLVGGPKGNWIAPLVKPIGVAFKSMFGEERFTSIIGEMSGEELEVLAQLMADGEIRTVIDQRFTLAETADAIRYSLTGRARGKIIIIVP